ncbi:hypothetical protein T440DRAFT_489164 [Plenodomus tracheiphilus IPT5]|uniref:Uncharacterized protein n=1 Tax=Plenodomus tracheiphilus IPT5 TaxID=1408161 RepID=A0A6A7B9Q2_9PLEO|nr:hypothetical protein T440DRAFT_489164 [Plenodomus tracheiphilus IPT5]
MAQQTGAPISPSSSKRSRSRDSAASATNSSLNTPAANTPLVTPSVSTNSLIIPSSTPGTPANGEYSQDGTPYPPFLLSSRADLNAKWGRLDWTQMDRLRDSAQAIGAEHPGPWARCSGDDYALRNRYINVDPYQANRVRLEVPEGQFDYINASPVVLETTKSQTSLRYIATQGPKADSWSHIWRMIWKENTTPAVIVMLTQTHETGREKCYPYYPQSPSIPDLRINEHDEFGDGFIHTLHLASLSHHEEARTQVREIDMTNNDGSESKKIWHLLFAAWPDFSVPEGADRAAMLKLIDISREKNSDNATNPRIVHCSAGIGRSGTFIALDWLLQELEEGSLDATPESEDPIMKVVELLRDQRAGMVQSKNQFFFIYDVLRERWRERWINLHPDEAAKLGIASPASSDSQPALKRRKSTRDSDVMIEDVANGTVDAEARARLEAELMDADARVGI